MERGRPDPENPGSQRGVGGDRLDGQQVDLRRFGLGPFGAELSVVGVGDRVVGIGNGSRGGTKASRTPSRVPCASCLTAKPSPGVPGVDYVGARLSNRCRTGGMNLAEKEG